jgi:Domain of Unknown Function (DUF1259)
LVQWLAFANPGSDAMVMGDLVFSEDEVSPVVVALQEEGLHITALHNHVLHETPRVMYMHIEGHGNAAKLASSLKKVIALTKTPLPAMPASTPPATDLDTATIDQTLGYKGKISGGVYHHVILTTGCNQWDRGLDILDTAEGAGLNFPFANARILW